MQKHLVKHGNSAALIIEKPILELLNVDMDTPLEISTDGKNIIISPQADAAGEKKVIESLLKVNLKHKNTLKKLSK